MQRVIWCKNTTRQQCGLLDNGNGPQQITMDNFMNAKKKRKEKKPWRSHCLDLNRAKHSGESWGRDFVSPPRKPNILSFSEGYTNSCKCDMFDHEIHSIQVFEIVCLFSLKVSEIIFLLCRSFLKYERHFKLMIAAMWYFGSRRTTLLIWIKNYKLKANTFK